MLFLWLGHQTLYDILLYYFNLPLLLGSLDGFVLNMVESKHKSFEDWMGLKLASASHTCCLGDACKCHKIVTFLIEKSIWSEKMTLDIN